jgi:HTH-type transcriptional regulator, transcriptional repressor of NAD biosynthesis genes
MEEYMSQKYVGSGLVFGKFLPFHAGHQYLINFARASCRRLTILVCTLPSEPIPGEIRFQWVKEMYPDCNVVHHYAEIPQNPEEHPDFWNIWKRSIEKHCPFEEFDALFGSEDYGWRMAETMGIDYVPVNRERDLLSVSGTEIRNNPYRCWKYIPEVARPYFARRVAIVGPESTGKSMLAENLAEHYATVRVSEYARGLLDEYAANRFYKPGEVRYEDIATIARGQKVTEDFQARRCNKVLFCDTELMTTVFWSNYYFGKCPEWVKKEAQERKYNMYLLLAPDVPYAPDAQRPMSDIRQRRKFFEWWKARLDGLGARYAVIAGSDWQQRFEAACEAVERALPEIKG